MKKINFYENSCSNLVKRGFALATSIIISGSFVGCSNEGWKSNDYDDVHDKVSYIKTLQESTIKEVFKKYFTFEEAKDKLVRMGIYLSDEEIEWYLDMYKGANPKYYIDPEQKELENSILESHKNNENRKKLC